MFAGLLIWHREQKETHNKILRKKKLTIRCSDEIS